WRKILGVLHPKRRKHVVLNVNVFRLTRDLLEQSPKQDVVDVGVRKTSAGRDCSRVVSARCMPSALSAPSSPHGSCRLTSIPSPEVFVSNMRTVTRARCGSFVVLKSGRYFCTGSSKATLPCS